MCKHKIPLNDNELGYYLAGLIDGDGNFNNQKGNLTICFDIRDIDLAYNLKSKIGYGRVSKIKDKKAVKLVISSSDGLLRILTLINGKLKIKYNQVINNVLSRESLIKSKFYIENKEFFNGDLNDFNNYWLAGFIDADGSLQIKILKRANKSKEEIRVKLQISQKEELILIKIRDFLCSINNDLSNDTKGAYLGLRKHKNKEGEPIFTYYLETTSFKLIKNVICYLDIYSLQSYKYLHYIYIYKIYLLIQNKDHLTLTGIKKIKEYKEKKESQ